MKPIFYRGIYLNGNVQWAKERNATSNTSNMILKKMYILLVWEVQIERLRESAQYTHPFRFR